MTASQDSWVPFPAMQLTYVTSGKCPFMVLCFSLPMCKIGIRPHRDVVRHGGLTRPINLKFLIVREQASTYNWET